MSCNICEEDVILACPSCESHARYDIGEEQQGEELCAECNQYFYWTADYEIVMEVAQPMATYHQSGSYLVDPIHGGINEEPVRVPVECPACHCKTTTRNVYQYHHDYNWERCRECDHKFLVVNHGKLSFCTSPIFEQATGS